MLNCDNPFWHFSLAVYDKPDVAGECLDLQSQLNVDVNALLFCAWLGNAHRIKLTGEQLAAIDAHVLDWHRTVVRSLRTVRQAVKPMPAMADDAVKHLRREIVGVELRAEQIEQAMLFELTQSLVAGAAVTSAADAVRHNVMAMLRHTKSQAMSRDSSAGSEPSKADRLVAESIAYWQP
ncbi:MAG: TIGR02444 family protein [Pseudolabrys sp.]|nr:TIGR02444 family protein [Pseudolabrys sp.]